MHSAPPVSRSFFPWIPAFAGMAAFSGVGTQPPKEVPVVQISRRRPMLNSCSLERALNDSTWNQDGIANSSEIPVGKVPDLFFRIRIGVFSPDKRLSGYFVRIIKNPRSIVKKKSRRWIQKSSLSFDFSWQRMEAKFRAMTGLLQALRIFRFRKNSPMTSL